MPEAKQLTAGRVTTRTRLGHLSPGPFLLDQCTYRQVCQFMPTTSAVLQKAENMACLVQLDDCCSVSGGCGLFLKSSSGGYDMLPDWYVINWSHPFFGGETPRA